MKYILPVLILLSTLSHAQNYQCLQSGVKHYFTNANGYLRGIRIDSVNTLGDTTVYYPFHSRRGNNNDLSTPLDSNGASWLGKEVLQLADGTFLFDNMWQNPVKIKTQAHTGDTWTFYSDTSMRYYRAEVISEGIMTLPGGDDSVKIVRINAYDTAALDTNDHVNNFTFTLSKDHGFVTIFDLYTFPYPAIPSSSISSYYSYDYLLWNVTKYYSYGSASDYPTAKNSLFSVISLINPTYGQLYDWHPGDVFENQIFSSSYTSDGLYPYGYYYDSIIDRTVVAGNIQYTYTGWLATMHYSWSTLMSGPINPDAQYPYDTVSTSGTFSVSNSLLIDTTMMPEEKDQPWFIYYVPNDSVKALPWYAYFISSDETTCLVSNRYTLVQTGMPDEHYYIYFEATPISREYKTGLGLIEYHWDILGGSPPEVQDTTLIYYVKGGDTCGHYTPPNPIYDATGVGKTQNVKSTAVYPNPVSNQLIIQLTGEPVKEIIITSPLGQTVYYHREAVNIMSLQIDVSSLPSGIYFARINGTDVRKFFKE